MSKERTLVVLTPAFPADESETYWIPFLQLMIKSLRQSDPGLTIIILSFFHPVKEEVYYWNSIKVISFDAGRYRNWKHVLFWRRIWKTLKNIKQHHDVIGIFSIWCGECAFIGKYFAKSNSIRQITWICGQDALRSNKWVRYIRPAPEQLAAESPFLLDLFEKNHGIRPQFMLPNSVDPSLFPPALTDRSIDIMGAGSLVELKQYDQFVEVIAAVRQGIPGIRARHCGTGDQKQKIETLINDLGLKDNVRLLGNTKHADVLKLMQQTKIFLHTSRFEGFSGVCLEALYAGVHVISYVYPLDHSVAHWHIVKNKEEMAAKAIELLTNPQTEYSRVTVYSINDTAKSLLGLFNAPLQTK